MDKQKLIDQIYNDPEQGFLSQTKLYKKVKEVDKDVTLDDIKTYLKGNTTDQLHKSKRGIDKGPPLFGAKGQFQLDLTFFNQYASANNKHTIILVAVEINSKKAYAEALKSKSAKAMADALQVIIEKIGKDGRTATIFQSDNGTEFTNSEVKKLLEKNNIQQRFCQKDDKRCLGVAERFNRTIKNLLNRYMTANKTARWVDVLPKFIENYNNTYHSTIKMKPNEFTDEDEKAFVNSALQKTAQYIRQNEIKVGDSVRIPVSKSKFEKEGVNFSNKIYIVEEVGISNLSLAGLKKKYRISSVLKVNPEEVSGAETPHDSQDPGPGMWAGTPRNPERQGGAPTRGGHPLTPGLTGREPREEAKKQSKIQRKLKKEDLLPSEVLPKRTPRTAAQNAKAINKVLSGKD